MKFLSGSRHRWVFKTILMVLFTGSICQLSFGTLQNDQDSKVFAAKADGNQDVIIDFDALPGGTNPGNVYDGVDFAATNTWSNPVNGFIFRSSDAKLTITSGGKGTNSTHKLYKPDWQPASITMKKFDGGTFRFFSFTYTCENWNSLNMNLNVKGYDAGGTMVVDQNFSANTHSKCHITNNTADLARVEFSVINYSDVGHPALDSICVNTEVSVVAVTGVELNTHTLTLGITESAKLDATVFPLHATNKDITWSSTDTNIAVVNSNGYVTGIAPGVADVTVRSDDGNYPDTCRVTVIYEIAHADLVNAGFETPALSAGSYENNPSNAEWSFNGISGIVSNQSELLNPDAPQGVQAAFLTGKPGQTLGSIRQNLKFKNAGYYVLSYHVARNGSQVQPVMFSMEGVGIGKYTPGSNHWVKVTTAAFHVTDTAKIYTLELAATEGNIEKTVFIDNLKITRQFTGTPLSIGTTGQTSCSGWTQQMGPAHNGVVADMGVGHGFDNDSISVKRQFNVGFGTAPVVVDNNIVYAFGLYKPGTTPANLSNIAQTPNWNNILTSRTTPDGFDCATVPGNPANYYPMTEAGFNNGNGYQKKAYRGDEYATAWNIETGALVWATKLTDYGVAWYDGVHWGYPSSSPLIADGKVYIFNEQSELYCLDAATGSLVWPQPIKMWDHGMWAWTVGQCGSATSPLKVGNAIIVTYSGSGNSNYTQWGQYKRIAAAFDATTGNHLWTRPAPRDGAFYQPSRITYAEINEDPTVLMSYGGGVAGINPANGSIRWSYEHPYGSYYANWDVYNPVVYQNYVVISEPLAHDDAESATFGIQITNNQPTLLWETHAFVVNGHGEKNNMVAWDGKIYGFDAHGVWDIQPWTSYERDHHGSSASGPGRNYRGEEAGRFQCLDIASGDMLWSSHAFDPASYELNFNPFILCGNHIIATERNGLWVGNISANGVNITGRIGGATNARILGEPVVCGPNLYIRQIDTESSQWVTDIGTNQGNLTILGHQRIITSANEMEGQPVTGITLYPNPTCDRITISLDELLNEAGICIFGPDGRICHSESLYKNTSDICVKGLSPGVYVVKVNNGDHVWHSRMVIK